MTTRRTGTLVNVLGAPRSGTTMLDLMLGNDENAFSCGEAYAFFRPFRTHHYSLNCPCGNDPCDIWEKLKSVPESELHVHIVRRLGVQYVIDSAKDLNWFFDAVGWARHHGLTVRNVVIWKNPVNLAYSFWKRSGSIRDLRTHCVTYYDRLIRLGVPFVAVNYEELVADPELKLRQLCDAIDMAYFGGKERFWEKEHHFLFGSLGTRRQCQSGDSEIRGSTIFNDGFSPHAERIRQQMGRDPSMRAVRRELEHRDVAGSRGGAPIDWEHFELPSPPLWYHLRRYKQRFQKSFPAKSPPHYR